LNARLKKRMSKPEQGILIPVSSRLWEVAQGDFSAVYFGSETCGLLLPRKTDIDILRRLRDRFQVDFAVVTPYVTEHNLLSVGKLLGYLSKKVPGIEIVVNDWGVLQMVREDYPCFRIVLGRVLNRQRRGSLFVDTRDSAVRSVRDLKGLTRRDRLYLRASIAQNDFAMRLLNGLKVERVGLDNIAQGILLTNNCTAKIDLYYPYCYLASSFQCFTKAVFKKPFCFHRSHRCERPCIKKEILEAKICDESIFLAGNAQFCFSDKLNPAVLKNIDRLIKVVL
jgi:hypothetical protein